MTAPTLEERLRFHGVDQAARAALQAAAPAVARLLPKLLDQFYERLQGWPGMLAHFGGRGHIEQVKQKQVQHWLTIAEASFGAAYLDSVKRTWRIHARMDVHPSWFVGAYSWLGTALQQALLDEARGAARLGWLSAQAMAKAQAQALAIGRATLLDLDYAMDTYMEEASARRRQALQGVADQFEQDVLSVAEALSSAAVELQAASQTMSDAAQSTAHVSHGVYEASSSSVQAIQAAAAAAEELAASVSEVADRAERSNSLAAQAQSQAETATGTVAELNKTAQRIEDVLQLIGAIAHQTNLLALNATIEAARAGEAGKGFAVVASEVKALAEQTAEATGQISAQVQAVQRVSREAAAAMRAIGGDIGEISAGVSDITAAIQQQRMAVGEISQHVSATAARTQEAAQDVAGVRDSAGATGEAASQSLQAALDLARQAETLRAKAALFVDSVRAA